MAHKLGSAPSQYFQREAANPRPQSHNLSSTSTGWVAATILVNTVSFTLSLLCFLFFPFDVSLCRFSPRHALCLPHFVCMCVLVNEPNNLSSLLEGGVHVLLTLVFSFPFLAPHIARPAPASQLSLWPSSSCSNRKPAPSLSLRTERHGSVWVKGRNRMGSHLILLMCSPL